MRSHSRICEGASDGTRLCPKAGLAENGIELDYPPPTITKFCTRWMVGSRFSLVWWLAATFFEPGCASTLRLLRPMRHGLALNSHSLNTGTLRLLRTLEWSAANHRHPPYRGTISRRVVKYAFRTSVLTSWRQSPTIPRPLGMAKQVRRERQPDQRGKESLGRGEVTGRSSRSTDEQGGSLPMCT